MQDDEETVAVDDSDYDDDDGCIAPMVWAFLSTTVQLPATQKKVEGEKDIQLEHVNEAISCLAWGYSV